MHACNTAYYGQPEAMVALPMAASRICAEKSVKQLRKYLGIDRAAVVGASAGGGLDTKLQDPLDRPVEEIELSSRASNCLKAARIRTIRDLVGRRSEELL